MEGVPGLPQPLWEPPRLWVHVAIQITWSSPPSGFMFAQRVVNGGPPGQISPTSKTAPECEGQAVVQTQRQEERSGSSEASQVEACRGAHV